MSACRFALLCSVLFYLLLGAILINRPADIRDRVVCKFSNELPVSEG